MQNIFSYYSKLGKPLLNLMIAEFFLQMINMSFLQILLIYMEKSGYADYESAGFVSYRFLGVLLFSLPLGLFIRQRKIIPLFFISSACTPVLSLVIIFATENHYDFILRASQLLWGFSFICMQVSALPFILRNSPVEIHTEAITLSYATGSMGAIFSGTFIYLLKNSAPDIFNEKLILQVISLLGLASIIFVSKIKIREFVPLKPLSENDSMGGFGWFLIVKAIIPTAIIAIGAGLTIPFIGLFFFKIHGLDSDQFAILNSATTFLVLIMILLVPRLKYMFGYKVSVTLSQSLAVIALVFLASTEWYSAEWFALVIAIFCYALRQPLMNMAAPMTSDLTMKYVGKRNREIMSALTAATWSGSWFISSHIFKMLREKNFSYANVFLITAALYALGVIWYYFLILDFYKREKLGLTEKSSRK